MVRLEFRENQLSTLRNALVVAAERFDEDAKQFRDLQPQLEQQEKDDPERFRLIHSSACPRLAEQFDLQAKQTRELLDLFDERDELEGSPWGIERKEA